MTRSDRIRAEFVDFIAERLEQDVLYISKKYSTAAHLCCCGCGHEVVTPLNPAKRQLVVDEGVLSLMPSIGNWSFPCQSHYWITKSHIRWSAAMSPELIRAVQARDRRDAWQLVSNKPDSYLGRVYAYIADSFHNLIRWWRRK
jgi:hypothetical protein